MIGCLTLTRLDTICTLQRNRIQPSRQSEAGLLKERTIHDFNRHSQEKRVYSKAMWDRKSLTYKLYEIKTLAAVNLSQYDFS